MLTLEQKIYLVQCYGRGKSDRDVIERFKEKFPDIYV